MKKYYIIVLLFLSSLGFTGCELLGLDFQEPYDYDDQIGTYDNQLKMTAWQFMKSRTDIFSSLLSAIEYAEIDSAIFNKPDQTLLLVTNKGLTSSTAADLSYWYNHQIENGDGTTTMPLSWDVYPKDQVRQLVLYHIVKGAWSYMEISNATQGATTFFSTNSSLSEGYVALQIKREGAMSIYFNNFASHYKVDLKARTNNLQVPNGTYIHVMDNYLNYPTDLDMTLYPIYK